MSPADEKLTFKRSEVMNIISMQIMQIIMQAERYINVVGFRELLPMSV